MAEKMTDAEDKFLAELFISEPIVDGGFSRRITRRIQRRLWVDRLALPIAVCLGAAFALRPLTQLVEILVELLPARQWQSISAPLSGVEVLSDPQTLLFGGLILAGILLTYQFVDD